MFFLPHLFHYRPISPTLFILITVFLEPAPFADFSQVSRTQCFNLNIVPVLGFCFACVWTWSFIIPMVDNLFQNSFLIFACSRAFPLPSSFLCAGSPKSQLPHGCATFWQTAECYYAQIEFSNKTALLDRCLLCGMELQEEFELHKNLCKELWNFTEPAWKQSWGCTLYNKIEGL